MTKPPSTLVAAPTVPQNSTYHKMNTSVIQMMVDARVGSNATCNECRANCGTVTNALGPWVSCDTDNRGESVLFVGKVARGDCIGEQVAPFLEDVGNFGAEYIAKSSWPFWAYTREIIEAVYGDLQHGLRNVSFTNIVKCNNETTADTTSGSAKAFCIRQNRFIWKEIEHIRPRIVVFYTHTAYDDYIDEFMPSYAANFSDFRDCYVPVGEKQMPWWERVFSDANHNVVLRLLRVGHPERKKRKYFVKAVSEWIKEANES